MSNSEKLNKKRQIEKKILSKLISSPVDFLMRHHFTPNLLSFLGFLCILISAILISFGLVHSPIWVAWIVPFFLLFGGVFDVFDGEVARKTGKDSDTGAFLDSNVDRISDIIIIIGFVYGKLINFVLAFILMFLTIMISYTRAKAENLGLIMKGIGFLERAERLVILTVAIIVESWVYFLSSLFFQTPNTWFFPVFIIVFTILLLLTLLQRFYFSLTNLANF